MVFPLPMSSSLAFSGGQLYWVVDAVSIGRGVIGDANKHSVDAMRKPQMLSHGGVVLL